MGIVVLIGAYLLIVAGLVGVAWAGHWTGWDTPGGPEEDQ